MVKQTITTLSFLLFLSACASEQRPPPDLDDVFTTNIWANGLKMFSYSLIVDPLIKSAQATNSKQQRQAKQPRGVQGRGSNNTRRDTRDLAKRKRLSEAKRVSYNEMMEKLINEQLIVKLAATGYCREGHIILESYISRSDTHLRGECREGANDRDFKQFPNSMK